MKHTHVHAHISSDGIEFNVKLNCVFLIALLSLKFEWYHFHAELLHQNWIYIGEFLHQSRVHSCEIDNLAVDCCGLGGCFCWMVSPSLSRLLLVVYFMVDLIKMYVCVCVCLYLVICLSEWWSERHCYVLFLHVKSRSPFRSVCVHVCVCLCAFQMLSYP